MKCKDVDPQIAQLIAEEETRERDVLELIPSENYASKAVREALGSVLTNKYSEGYSLRRYYQGNSVVDKVETLAIERTKKLFGVPHANVQAYSGSPANAAVYFALLSAGDTIMGLKLSGGGHLTHGHPKITFSGKYFRSVQFDVEADGWLDMDKVAALASHEKPQLIVVGTTAYPRIFDWKRWKQIADSVGAYFLADISHVAGLIAAGAYPTPVPYADVIMFTTHKTMRGPRGAILAVTDAGIRKDKDMGQKIDRGVFPGLQGGPHDNVTAAIAVAMKEASTVAFREYGRQIVKNAQALARILIDNGLTLTTGGTDSHLLVIDLRPMGVTGDVVAEALEVANIVVNYNTVPHDTNPPMHPSGIRLGTPILTTRGLKEKDMDKVGVWISRVVAVVAKSKVTKEELWKNTHLLALGREVRAYAKNLPVP